VARVLGDLGIDADDPAHVLEAHNKIDRLGPDERGFIDERAARNPRSVAISARDGSGMTDLLALIDQRLSETREILVVDVSLSDGAALAWLYRNGEVLAREDDELVAHLQVALDPADAHRFSQQFDRAAAE
jgi:GTP-binding protein HflX